MKLNLLTVILIILGFVALVAIGLLIAASVQDMTIIEMIQSWFSTGSQPPENVVEGTVVSIKCLIC